MRKMVSEASWEEFRRTGLLWWINRTLHLFGWALVLEMNDDGVNVQRVYPARCLFRGFDEDSEETGFEAVTRFMVRDSQRLLDEMLEQRRIAAGEEPND